MKKSLAIFCLIGLVGCGGGGAAVGPNVALSSSFGQLTEVNSVQLLAGQGNNTAVIDWFTIDLNNDGLDEIILAGRQTQPVQAPNHRQFYLQIYGWNTGTITNETTRWLSGEQNLIVGSEPAVRFADFNGDGRIDILVAPSTDMRVYGSAVVYFNDGKTLTRRDIDVGQVWAHDAAVADFNKDGYADFLLTDYGPNMVMALGSRNGDFLLVRGRNLPGASSVMAADFMGDGTQTLILTDNETDLGPSRDITLYRYSLDNSTLTLTKIASLPKASLWQDKWQTLRSQTNLQPHEFRGKVIDFNNDGRPDVIIVSTVGLDYMKFPDSISAVQFLRNDGNGHFTDVTDDILYDYNHSTNGSYQPVLIDANNDGREDIFLSASENDYNQNAHNSTRLLMQTADGKYRDNFADTFRRFRQAMVSVTSGATSWAFPITIARGPGGRPFLIGTVAVEQNAITKHSVYAAEFTCMTTKMSCN